ncbi:hypothetical protein D3H65_03150 [Paraflavitalea soli]|uniref:Uncharacterized protein n=2 Tax=Paraflavitalea soli TaxID=2315862 RepID=A0A3B7MIZ5_9BACT|nr:hypothetical protein D3H65_03150 [Paraflavitalea soli]
MTSPQPFKNRVLVLMVCLFAPTAWLAAQDQRTDTVPTRSSVDTVTHPFPVHIDSVETALRIKNLNPYFTLHVDSTLTYRLEINKDESKFYWYLRNSPVGLRINKDNGTLTFKAEKSYFLSGKLRYDNEYRVNIGVQSLDNPTERVDTSFAIVFYNTEIVPAKIKPSVNSTVTIDEGDTLSFKVQCDFGSFPIDNITFLSNMPIKNYTTVRKCDDDFTWSPPFDFVKDSDPGKEKIVLLSFIGTNRFMVRDTAVVRVIVKDALNYPFALQEYNLAARNINTYVLQLKYTFVQLDKGVKKTKGARTGFDITSSTTALTGTILTSSTSTGAQQTGKILPSVGVSLVPIKEAVAPQKVFDQNQASSIRSSIKRLDYMLQDNAVVGERDPDISKKTAKLKDELKQIQIQLIDIPLEMTRDMSEKDLNEYFNSPKVNKKYRLKK